MSPAQTETMIPCQTVNRSAARGGLHSHTPSPRFCPMSADKTWNGCCQSCSQLHKSWLGFNIYFVPGRRERAKPEETNAAVILCILQLSKLRLRKGSHFVIVTQPERNSTEPEFVPGQLGSRALVLVKPLSHTESYI